MTNPNKLADALRSTLREYRAEAARHDGLAGTVCNLIGDHLEGLLAEHDAQPAQGEWVMVPKVPTEAMIEAAEIREDDEPLSDWGEDGACSA